MPKPAYRTFITSLASLIYFIFLKVAHILSFANLLCLSAEVCVLIGHLSYLKTGSTIPIERRTTFTSEFFVSEATLIWLESTTRWRGFWQGSQRGFPAPSASYGGDCINLYSEFLSQDRSLGVGLAYFNHIGDGKPCVRISLASSLSIFSNGIDGAVFMCAKK